MAAKGESNLVMSLYPVCMKRKKERIEHSLAILCLRLNNADTTSPVLNERHYWFSWHFRKC